MLAKLHRHRVLRRSPDPAPFPNAGLRPRRHRRRHPTTHAQDPNLQLEARLDLGIDGPRRRPVDHDRPIGRRTRQKNLPPVAARNREAAETQPADEAAQPSRRKIGISAAPQSPTPPSETIAFDGGVHEKDDALSAPASAPAPIAGEVGGPANGNSVDLGSTSAPLAAATPAMKLRKEETKTASGLGGATSSTTAQPGEAATDKLTSALQPSSRVSGSPGERQFDAEKQKAGSLVTPSAQRFVIVHVVAKSESLKSGSVERLLADNKIEFVPQPTKDQPRSFGGEKLAKLVQSKSASTEKSDKVAEIHATDTEMVLVDAPQPTIESCLADLNKNSNDFLSVDVNEAPQSHDRFDGKQTLTKSLAENKTNLSRFSRGTAPLTQNDSVDLRKYFYSYDFDKKNEPVASGSPRGRSLSPEGVAGPGVVQDVSGGEKSDYKDKPPSEIRRARSIETRGTVDRQPVEVPATPAAAHRTHPSRRRSSEKTHVATKPRRVSRSQGQHKRQLESVIRLHLRRNTRTWCCPPTTGQNKVTSIAK